MALTDLFVLSLFFVFAAELGDKTQLVALAFATRCVAQTLLLGVFGHDNGGVYHLADWGATSNRRLVTYIGLLLLDGPQVVA